MTQMRADVWTMLVPDAPMAPMLNINFEFMSGRSHLGRTDWRRSQSTPNCVMNVCGDVLSHVQKEEGEWLTRCSNFVAGYLY